MTPANPPLPDAVVLALYQEWSEEFYAASFMHAFPDCVEHFRFWLREEILGPTRKLETYEEYMLAEFRRQEAEAVEAT